MIQVDELLKLLRPLYLLSLSATYLPITIFKLITTLQLDKFTSWDSFQEAWFSYFWSYFGPLSTQNAAATVEPLLRNARGVVLDIGPGSGQWLYLFKPDKSNGITKIYGVEPNTGHHPALRKAIVNAGLKGIYEILPVGVENLESCGLQKGSIDTIVTVQVLCSVPGPESIVKELYPYLRPGGLWIVYEHIKTKFTGDFIATWQRESARDRRKRSS